MFQFCSDSEANRSLIQEAWAFDLDGTLLDTLEDLASTVRTVLLQQGYQAAAILPTHAFRQFVGSGVATLFRRIWEQEWKCSEPLKEEQLQTWVLAFHEEYRSRSTVATRPYPEIPSILDQLQARGAQLAVLTNKPQQAAEHLIQSYFPDRFVAVLGLEEGGIPKPDLRNTRRLQQVLKVPLDQWTMVGDSDVDIWTARQAQMRAVGVSWGFRGRMELKRAGADFCLDHPSELLQLPRLLCTVSNPKEEIR